MNCKQYRACLIGVIAVALLCGIVLCIRYEKENRIPADGMLVQREQEINQNGALQWA